MKRNKFVLGLCATVFIIGLIGCIWVMLVPRGTVVDILQDGEVLYHFDLSKTEDCIFEIKSNAGVNTIQIEDGKIRVSEADCPDQICVHMGWLESASLPIVCLPHQLSIEYEGVEG